MAAVLYKSRPVTGRSLVNHSRLTKPGKVYLVGAGPGAVEYLTVKAHQLLCRAEALVHDALVNPEVLALVPEHCQVHAMGKRGGAPSTTQAAINQLLITLCQQGQQVVRLKSGDPFIFGRTPSEIQALRGAGCPFEVVPGLSSALAAPVLASVPLTDPVLGSHFAVLTAHDLDAQNWAALAQMATLVILMGGKTLPEICDRLIQHDKRPDTPVVVIRWASQPHQQLWEGTLLTIPQVLKGQRLSPCIIVIGEVVGLRPYLR